MNYFLGIDGGGTHTSACLADENGNVVGRAEGGLGNPNHASDEELSAHFSEILARLFGPGAVRIEECVSVFAGMAGVTCEETGARIARLLGACGLGRAQIGVDHDIRIALAGGLAGRPGIALIVGTGSSCYGRDACGKTCQTGGWGALIADEGSGYALGRDAMVAAARMADGRQAETPLRKAVFDWLGISDVSQILHRIYEQELTRPQIAGFAPTLLQLAAEEDHAAVEILVANAHELARMVAANHARLPTAPTPEVVITGGLGTADSPYRPLVKAAIQGELPTVKFVTPELDPVAGAALLAIEQHAGSLFDNIVANLKDSQ